MSSMTMNSHLKRFTPLVAATLSLSLAAMAAAEGRTSLSPKVEDPVVVTIDSETVTANEFRLVMLRNVSDVFSRFKREKDLDDHVGYWKDTGPDSPMVALRKETLDELTGIKVEQALAKQKGLIGESGFAFFQESFAKENERRAKALAAKEVIYGPREYSLAAYYYIQFDEMAYQLRQKLAKEAEPSIPEEAVRALYEKHRTDLKDAPFDDVRARLLEKLALEKAEEVIATAKTSAKVEVDAELIAKIQVRSDS